MEIISLLDVKTIQRFRCVRKSWNLFISDQTFIQMHLKKSSRNPHFVLPIPDFPLSSTIFLPVQRLLENHSITVAGDSCLINPILCDVVGSCNGLLCVVCYSATNGVLNLLSTFEFFLWNPATRTMSENLGFFGDYEPVFGPFKFSFGCDCFTGTYKVVLLHTERNEDRKSDDDMWISKVRVFSLGDNCWRFIQGFPLAPLIWSYGVHLSGTVNWLAIRGAFMSMYDGEIFRASVPVKQLEIVSLDLSTETNTQFLLPEGFVELPCVEPYLCVIMDCLCFSHDFNKTEFVIWQMKEFGVQESWTQLFRIEYFNLQMNNPPMEDDFVYLEYMKCDVPLLPLYVSKDGDTLILAHDEIDNAVIYNQRDKRVQRSINSNEICWLSAIDYVESLVSTHWKSGVGVGVGVGVGDGDENEDKGNL
ncbi:hypothetical protein KIW84_011172 [Lathyrus oleraceus]|uniref:F-box associated beta-propeller type 1 domain-containing protein n=2 Tax=Pisum sativum TaxID=3888 RepID=A0A9D4YMS6_PEA|nr:hypothetical protein KIW84_011172 [Pisum sativum]